VSGAFSPENDVQTRLNGDGWGYAGRLGLHWQLSDRWSLGAAYHSGVHLGLNGRAHYDIPLYTDVAFKDATLSGTAANQVAAALFPNTDIATEIDLPPTMSGGVAYRVSDRLIVETDVSWTGWSSYDSLNVVYESLAGETDVPAKAPKHWKDVLAVRIGAEVELNEHLVGRIGYAFDESPIPDATRDPSLAGADRHDLAVGFGYSSSWWTMNAAYLYVIMSAANSQLTSDTGGDLTGRYETAAHVLTLATTFRF
jgi:long-chain fatty acid transport protein